MADQTCGCPKLAHYKHCAWSTGPCAVKIRVKRDPAEPRRKPWWFLNSKGSGVRLRIHAARWECKAAAQAFVASYTAENPHLEFKVVEL